MKGAPWLVLAGTAAGLIGVLSFHTRPAQQAALSASGIQGAGGHPGGGPASPSARAAAGAGNDGGSVRSALGPDVQFGYGVLDVKVTVRGTRITDISVPSLQTAEPTSQQISEQAIPVLRSEVLAARGASIDAVSGATYQRGLRPVPASRPGPAAPHTSYAMTARLPRAGRSGSAISQCAGLATVPCG